MFTNRLAGLAIGTTCMMASACAHEVRPDDMSAEAHHAAAQREARQAQREIAAAAYDSPGRDPSNAGMIPELYTDPDANPDLAYDPGVRARALEKRAQEHENAAVALESFEAAACKNIPSAQRGVCPSLRAVTEVRDIEGGVRLRLDDESRSHDVLPSMRCHYAYARAHAFDDRSACPLSIRGVEFRETSDPHLVDVVGRDAKTSAEIRKRVRDGILGRVAASTS
jgi:hypothetical protein